jgi:alkylation response protein AidB-like acyl-CoA dehydrogenase
VDRKVTIRCRRAFDEDHTAFRGSVAQLLSAEPADFLPAAGNYGFVALATPEEFGGPGVPDPRFPAVLLEEAMAAGRPDLALLLAAHENHALPLLLDAPDHLARAASDLLEGRLLLAVVDGTSTVRAEPQGSGWVLDGAVDTVPNGVGAGLLVVLAQSEEGVLSFVLDGAAAGLTRIPVRDVLGLERGDLADLRFEATPVATSDRVDADLDGARARYSLALAVAATAGARAALAMTVDYVKQRKAFGTPIASFANTQRALGTLGARVTAVEAFLDACLENAADLSGAEASAVHLCAIDVLGEAVDCGVQLHGGYGYMWEYPIARAYAAARFFRAHAVAPLHGRLASAVGL